MVDIEHQVYTALRTAVGSSASIKSEYVRIPAVFPCVTVEEISNTSVEDLMDSSTSEKFARVRYRVQVFSNKQDGKKVQAREIFNTVDTAMTGMGFRRQSYSTRPELYDASMYNINATYEAIVSASQVIYSK